MSALPHEKMYWNDKSNIGRPKVTENEYATTYSIISYKKSVLLCLVSFSKVFMNHLI